jgi:hypothetical protein
VALLRAIQIFQLDVLNECIAIKYRALKMNSNINLNKIKTSPQIYSKITIGM